MYRIVLEDRYSIFTTLPGPMTELVGYVGMVSAAEDFTASVVHVYRSPFERGDGSVDD